MLNNISLSTLNVLYPVDINDISVTGRMKGRYLGVGGDEFVVLNKFALSACRVIISQ